MDFRPNSDLSAFREEVRAFLRARLPEELKGGVNGIRGPKKNLQRWQSILHDQGWGAPSWSQEDGGTGWNAEQLYAFDEECAAADAPPQDNFGQRLLGPVLNKFGTPAQKAEHSPGILGGERLWCQGFSEPQAGSDLASLRTQAVLDGDEYVVNGQKIWTSYAHESDWIFLLVRTNTAVKKQAGISFLLVDMKTAGITVKPILTIDGCHHLNETFFDNVRVPVGNRVGEEGGGWGITKFLLNNEHALTAELPTLLRFLRQLKRLGESQVVGGMLLIERSEFLLRLLRMEGELRALSMMVRRVVAFEMDQNPQAHILGSLLKVRATDLQQRMSEFLVESLGDYGAVDFTEGDQAILPDGPIPFAEFGAGIASEMFFRRAATIYGGTSEVQRGIVAKLLFQF